MRFVADELVLRGDLRIQVASDGRILSVNGATTKLAGRIVHGGRSKRTVLVAVMALLAGKSAH
jgi:hypothetical protein